MSGRKEQSDKKDRKNRAILHQVTLKQSGCKATAEKPTRQFKLSRLPSHTSIKPQAKSARLNFYQQLHHICDHIFFNSFLKNLKKEVP